MILPVSDYALSGVGPIAIGSTEPLVVTTDPPIEVRGDAEFVADFLVPLAVARVVYRIPCLIIG